MNEKIKIALIYGSNRVGRFCDVIATWTIAQMGSRNDFEITTVDPAAMSLPNKLEKGHDEDLDDFRKKIKAADAFIIVTPEYNHGYPAVLKFLIDSEYEGWRAKPIAFVSYGGFSGGIRAVEQLRQVFSEMHATTVRDSVHFSNSWEQFDKAGNLIQTERAEKMMAATLNQLSWWAIALREARIVKPYSL